MSLEALVLRAGEFQLPLPALRSNSEPRPFGSQGYSRQEVGLQAISSTLRSVYAWEADVCYPLATWEWEPSYTLLKKDIGNRCIQLRYTGFRHSDSQCFSPQPIPATNIRMLAGYVLQSGRMREGSSLSSALTGKHV